MMFFYTILSVVITCAVNIQEGRFSVQHSWYDYAEWLVKSAKKHQRNVHSKKFLEQLSLLCELSCVMTFFSIMFGGYT